MKTWLIALGMAVVWTSAGFAQTAATQALEDNFPEPPDIRFTFETPRLAIAYKVVASPSTNTQDLKQLEETLKRISEQSQSRTTNRVSSSEMSGGGSMGWRSDKGVSLGIDAEGKAKASVTIDSSHSASHSTSQASISVSKKLVDLQTTKVITYGANDGVLSVVVHSLKKRPTTTANLSLLCVAIEEVDEFGVARTIRILQHRSSVSGAPHTSCQSEALKPTDATVAHMGCRGQVFSDTLIG